MSEPDVSELLTVEQAIEILDAVEVSPRVIALDLSDADGLVLAEDLFADRDAPPFRKSQMDGYAVRCADVVTAPVKLHLIGEIAAGSSAARGLAPGETMSIMTGAPLPNGADGVIPIEFTERTGDRVRILQSTTPGRFIAEQGSDVGKGETVLSHGTSLGPAQLAVAASIGASRVRVFARPKIAVLSTGDEIIPIEATPTGSQIRNSNSTLLVALLKRLHCEVYDLGIVRDDRALIRTAIDRAMRDHDVIFITGGMSMGEYDFVPKVLQELNVDLKITKLRVKPGKPFVFGTYAKTTSETSDAPSTTLVSGGPQGRGFVFGLPGNPVSGFVCTVRLASRLIKRLSGRDAENTWRDCTLAEPLPQNGPREFYQPGMMKEADVVTPLEWKGSADIYTLARANVLIVRSENAPALVKGGRVRVLEIPS